MHITVIMVNFNGLRYLKETVPAVLNLDYPNFGFIVVDNGSTDGSIDYLKKFKDLTLLESTVKGSKNHACNYAVKKARGEYILLIDNDILLQNTDLLTKLVERKSSQKMIQPVIINKGETKTNFYGIFFTIYGPSLQKKDVELNALLSYKDSEIPIAAPYAGAYFFHKETWLDIGGYDEIHPFALDDFDIGPRGWVMGLKSVLFTKSFVLHLGIENRKNKEVLVKRFKLRFSGLAISMFKNYSFFSLIKTYPFFSLIQFVQAVRYSFKERSFLIFLAYCSSILFFLKNLPYIFKQRSKIQSKRVFKDAAFLKLRLPF